MAAKAFRRSNRMVINWRNNKKNRVYDVLYDINAFLQELEISDKEKEELIREEFIF